MNRIYKVIYSKARQCYIVVSELAKSNHKSSQQSVDHTNTPALARIIAVALAAGALTWGSVPGMSQAADKDIVDKGAQPIAYDINPANDGTNIAVGKNAKVFIGGGTQESMLSFGEKADLTMWHGLIPTGWNIHSNPHAKRNLPEAIAVGTNSYARTGSIEIGAHTLAENKIAIGDTTADQLQQFGVASTTLGTNSYTGGGFATTIGSYNVQTNPYDAKNVTSGATKNAFATVIGTFNSNESLSSDDSTSGVANMISGTANKVTNSNGAIVMGAGNSVKNSIDYFDTSSYSSLFKSAADMQKALMDGVASSAGGATLVIGGANQAENTSHSQIMGVGNKVKSTSSKKIEYNYLDGFNSSITDASHVKVLGQNVTINKGADSNTVFGDNRTVAEGQTNNVIIGNADEKKPIKTEKKETVILGYNANATVDGGVAIGSGSIANVGAGQQGYYVKHDQRSEEGQGYPFQNNEKYKPQSAWISRAGAVSVGDTTNADQSKWITRQITGVAAGTNDTDAVNVAQLKNSQTRFYSIYDPGDDWLDIFPQIPNWEKYKNADNQGAQGYWSMAAGFGTSTGGIASTVIGSMSKIDNKWTDGGPYGTQGATAVSLGTLNLNLSDQVTDEEVNSDDPIVTLQDKEDSGVANSIIGQANLTKNSNGALIYGAGNIVTDSYRRVFSNGDNDWDSLVNQDMESLLSNPEKTIKTIGKVADISGGKAMVIGGGNVVDKAYDSQVMGVGNTVTGSNLDFAYKESPEIGNITDQFDRDAAREADVWTQYMESIRKKGTLLNLVDGYYSTLENGQNDYLIGTANEVTGDDASKNKSNIVFGDYHKLNNGNNNIIIGSADGAVVEKAKGYNEDDEYGITTSQEITGQKQHTENLVDAVMIGHNADVQKNGGVALGADSVAKGKNSLAAGVGALANGSNSVAIGTKAKAQNDALAVGESANAGNNGIAIGMHANAGYGQNMALGYYASVANGVGNSTALGYGSQVTKRDILPSDGSDGVVSVGKSVGQSGEKGMTRRIINVKDGVKATDAANVSQLTELKEGEHISIVDSATPNEKGQTVKTISVKVDGKIQEGDTGILSGDTVYNEVHVKEDGNDIKSNQTVAENLKALDSHVKTNAKNIEKNGQAIEKNSARIDTNSKNIEKNGQAIEKNSARIDTNSKNIEKNSQAIEKNSARIDTNSKNIEKNSQAIEKNSARIDTNSKNIEKNGQAIEKNSARINTNSKNIEQNSQAIEKNSARIDTNSKNIEKNGQAIEKNSARIDTNSKNIEKNGQAIEKNSARIDTNSKNIEKNGQAIEKNSARIDTNSKNIEKNGQAIEKNSARIDTNSKNIETLQKTKADTNLSNITDAGKTVINNIAKKSVKVEAGSSNVSVTTKDVADGPITYTVDVAKDLHVNSITSKTVTSDSVTAKTVTSDTVKTKNLSVSESASIGDVTINKGNQGTIDDLKNTAWDAKNITSGRAATEDQVKAATKNAVNYDDDTSKTITLREDTTIKNVANTSIEQGSKNAVNADTVYNETRVKQDGKYVKASNTAGENLSVLDNQVASNSSNITNLNGRVNNLDSKVNKVGAGAAALAALHPLDFDPEDKWDFAVGYGNYRDANSVAVGAFYRPDDDTMFSVGTNFGNGENMINAGVSFKFGPKGKSQVRPGSTQEITELRATVARQDDQLKKQDSEIKELKAMVQQLMAKQDKQAATK